MCCGQNILTQNILLIILFGGHQMTELFLERKYVKLMGNLLISIHQQQLIYGDVYICVRGVGGLHLQKCFSSSVLSK